MSWPWQYQFSSTPLTLSTPLTNSTLSTPLTNPTSSTPPLWHYVFNPYSSTNPLQLWQPMEMKTKTGEINYSGGERKTATNFSRPFEKEGNYSSGFEVSSFDNHLWVTFAPNAEIINQPQKRESYKPYRVYVAGELKQEPEKRYGHLGGYDGELIVSKMIYL